MRSSGLLPLLVALTSSSVTALSNTHADAPANATVIENNPPNVAYVATLPDEAFDKAAFPRGGNVKGKVSAVSRPDGIGVQYTVEFSNLPQGGGGPFLYHIHVNMVPANGNCTATLGHLDPYTPPRGDKPPCDKTHKQTCQVGDMSGKWGVVGSDPFTASYKDLFSSTLEGDKAFIGNRSIVFHYANTTRITCANFIKVDGSALGGSKPSSSFNRTTNSTNPSDTSQPATPTVPAASGSNVRVGILLLASLACSAACLVLGL